MTAVVTDLDIDAHRHEITALVRAASRRSLDWYRRPMEIANKQLEGFDPVTAADRAVEDEIRTGLTEIFPDHDIVGEERGHTGDGSTPYRWMIDPIDGTRAFICGQPMWGTLVGLQVDDRPIAGWMHIPALDETYVATPSGGAFIVGEAENPLVTRNVTDLDQAIVLCTHPDMFAPGPETDAFTALTEATRMTRYSGDCVNYGLLATGHADLVVENGLAAYDIVPLLPIIEASGAIVTDLAGKPPLDGGYVVAAGTPELHAAALEILAP